MMKITKTILWGLLAAAWLSGANAWAQADPLEQGAMSVRKLDEGLYYMEYRTEDLLPLLLRQQLHRRKVRHHADRVQVDRC